MIGLGVRSLLVLPQLWGSGLRGGWCNRAVGISKQPGIRPIYKRAIALSYSATKWKSFITQLNALSIIEPISKSVRGLPIC